MPLAAAVISATFSRNRKRISLAAGVGL